MYDDDFDELEDDGDFGLEDDWQNRDGIDDDELDDGFDDDWDDDDEWDDFDEDENFHY